MRAGILALALAAASPVDLESTVADAAQSGDFETMRTLLREGVDVNGAQGDGMTALHWAALRGDLEAAEMLLQADANVKARTRLGAYTPLILAAEGGHGDVVDALLRAGADPNAATSTGATPLMLAAASGSVPSVRALLDRGADPNAREAERSETALMFAAARDRADAIRILIERGADVALATNLVNVPELDKKAEDALRERLSRLKKERAQAAGTEEPKAEAKPERGKTVASKLFGWMVPDKEKKKEPESTGRRRRTSYGELVGMQGGLTALLFAARQGNVDAVRALLEKGAGVNQVSEASKTSPLLIAVMNGHFDLAKELLDRGADPKLSNEPAGVTPLYATINLWYAPHTSYPQPRAHLKQSLTHLDLVKALLDAGADPNVRLKQKIWFSAYNFDQSGIDETGATPFWRAAYGSDVPAMRLLKSYGADPSLATRKPPERPRIADQQGREIKDVSGVPPVPVGGPAVTPLHAASGAGYGEGFAANEHRNHPAGFLPAVQYLVEECGANVNARDHEGNTPLHNAAARGDVEMIRYLISKGADVKAVNREGQTTADMANGPVQRIQPFPEALELLVSLGAKNNHKCVSC